MSITPINAVTEHLIFIHLGKFMLIQTPGNITAFLPLQYAWSITMEAAFDFTTVSAVLVLTKMFNVNCGELHYSCSYLQSDMPYLRRW